MDNRDLVWFLIGMAVGGYGTAMVWFLTVLEKSGRKP